MKIKNILLGVFFIVIGLLMVIIPETCIKVIVILTGLAALVNGIYNLKKYFELKENSYGKKILQIKSISSIVIGIIAVFFPLFLMKSFAAIWTIITFVLAFYFIFYAVIGFLSSSVDENISSELKKKMRYESFICLLIAILLFITPIGSIIKTLFIICGIIGFLVGGFIIVKEIVQNKKNHSIKE